MSFGENKIEDNGPGSQSAINHGQGQINQFQITYIQVHEKTEFGLKQDEDSNQGQGQTGSQGRIRLSDFVGPASPIIRDQKFRGMEIQGPCVIYLIDGVTISNCGFSGIVEALFIEMPDDWKGLSGVIGLRNCTFEGCNFQNVSIIAKKVDIARIRQEFGLEK